MAILVERHGGKNKFTNPDFDIWQRGTSFATINDDDYSADRWIYEKAGAMVHTVSRDADVPTFAQSGHLSNYSLKIDCTTIDSSIATGEGAWVSQYIEGYNFKDLAQNEFTLSFWVKSTKTGTFCVAFVNSGNDRSYVAEYTIGVTDTWEKKTISVSASPSAGTWDYLNGIGLRVIFTLAAGSAFHTTKDAWQTGHFRGTSNQVNACDSTDNNFFLSQVQVELGSVATEFETRQYAEELALCQRYCRRITMAASNLLCNGMSASGTVAEAAFRIPVMHAAPTVTVSGGTDFVVQHRATVTDTISVVIDNISKESCRLSFEVSSGLTAGDGCYFRADATAGRWIEFDAEL